MRFYQINILLVALALAVATTNTLVLAHSDDNNSTQSNVTQKCYNELTKLNFDIELNQCIPISNVSKALKSNNTDPAYYVSTLDNLCNKQKCTDELINNRRNTFESECQEDLKANNSDIVSIDNLFLLYSPSRDAACFKNSTGGYCILELWYNEIEANTITTHSHGFHPEMGIDPMLNLPKEKLCTDCNKKIVNSFLNYLKNNSDIAANLTSWDVKTINDTLATKCNESFVGKNKIFYHKSLLKPFFFLSV